MFAPRLINETQGGLVVARTVLQPRGALERIQGLIGKKELEHGACFWIPACPGIHTFFMQFSLSLIWTNKKFQVTALCSTAPPGKLVFGPWSSWHVFEFQAGKLQSNVQKGDVLNVVH